MPKVSVIMPAYQAEKYINEAIQSVVNQQFTDWELIIADDGSRDGTAAVISLWAAKDSRIRWVQNETCMGAAKSRNKAIAASSGEFIAFLDADDIAYPQRLQKQVNYLQEHSSIGLVAHWLDIIDENSLPHPMQWVWRKEKDSHLPVFLLFSNAFALSSVMMRRSVWERSQGFSSQYEPCEDYALWSEAASLTGMHIIPEKMGARREHGDNWTAQAAEKSQLQTERIIASNISKLNLAPSKRDLHLHQQLRHRQFILNDDFAQSARNWLELLLHQNQQQPIYRQDAMAEVLAEIWYDYWHLRHWEGFSVLQKYFASPLWSNNSLRKNLLLAALVCKRFLK